MYYRLPGDDFVEFVAQLGREARGEGLEDWMVPQNTLWAMRRGRMVGVLKLRHRLNPALEKYGGHIGYFVRPLGARARMCYAHAGTGAETGARAGFDGECY